jgi:hypothetical protein
MQVHVLLTIISACFKEGVQRGDLFCFRPEQLKDPHLLGTLLGASGGFNDYSEDAQEVQ